MRSLNRIVMQKHSRDWIASLGPDRLDVAEISGKWGAGMGFRSHRSFHYPQHDPCTGPFRDEAGKVLEKLKAANPKNESIEELSRLIAAKEVPPIK